MWSDLQIYQVCNKKKYIWTSWKHFRKFFQGKIICFLRVLCRFYSLVLYHVSKRIGYITLHLQLLNYKRAKPLNNNIFFCTSGSLHISLYIFYICKHVGVPGSGQSISENLFLCACGECRSIQTSVILQFSSLQTPVCSCSVTKVFRHFHRYKELNKLPVVFNCQVSWN